jgi:membrane-bound serine protease (ClpP class)
MKPKKTFLISTVDEIAIIVVIVLVLLFYIHPEWWIYAALIAGFLLYLSIKLYIFYPHFKTPVTGSEALVGSTGKTLEKLNPEGKVHVHGEIWEARAQNDDIKRGERIVVVDVEGLELIVQKK